MIWSLRCRRLAMRFAGLASVSTSAVETIGRSVSVPVATAEDSIVSKLDNNQGYYLLDTDFWADFDRVAVTNVAVGTAKFASGDVTNGRVMQFVVVPEPGASVDRCQAFLRRAKILRKAGHIQ